MSTTEMPERAELPLGDLLVLELGESIAPAYAGRLLTELGASVTRVDDPSGSGLYGAPPILGRDQLGRPIGAAYLHLNRGKRSVALDLESSGGRTMLGALLDQVDVVIDGLGLDRLAALGHPHNALLEREGVIVSSITPFGLTGPYRDLPASDLTLLALGGLLNMVGDPEREPLSLGGSQAQYAAGMSAFAGTMAALLYRDRSGAGQLVDTSVIESIAFIEWKSAVAFESDGSVVRRVGDHSPCPILPTRDGFVGLMYQDKDWPAVKAMTGLAALDESRFATREGREEHALELREILAPWFRQRGKLDVYRDAQGRRIPLGYVADLRDLLDSEQYRARGFWETAEHADLGSVSLPGVPYRISGVPRFAGLPPALGQDSNSPAALPEI